MVVERHRADANQVEGDDLGIDGVGARQRPVGVELGLHAPGAVQVVGVPAGPALLVHQLAERIVVEIQAGQNVKETVQPHLPVIHERARAGRPSLANAAAHGVVLVGRVVQGRQVPGAVIVIGGVQAAGANGRQALRARAIGVGRSTLGRVGRCQAA